MDSDSDTACAVGCPIRKSRDQRLLASPPGLSQRATSFIASQCQGIHQMPFSSRLSTTPNGKYRYRIAAEPVAAGAAISHEDTCRTRSSRRFRPSASCGCRTCPPRSRHILAIHPVNQRRAIAGVTTPKLRRDFMPSDSWRFVRPATRMVEVNGIEPMTSCLQSRRSPN